jgi:hypothetical protein
MRLTPEDEERLFAETMCHLLATLPVHDERTRP